MTMVIVTAHGSRTSKVVYLRIGPAQGAKSLRHSPVNQTTARTFAEQHAAGTLYVEMVGGNKGYTYLTNHPMAVARPREAYRQVTDAVVLAQGEWPEIWDTFVAHAHLRALEVTT